jgi:transmembrane 9 superfamily protein 2/4
VLCCCHLQVWKAYERGYYVGFQLQESDSDELLHFLYNHLRFNILYHKDAATDLSRIVGFEVEAFSAQHRWGAILAAVG